MDEKLKIAILGCGAGGLTMAAYLISKDFKVNLSDLPKFEANVKPIQERGGVEIRGELSGFFEPNMVTTDIREAIEGVNTIMIISRAMGHKPLIESCLPHLEEGQILLTYTPYWTSLRVLNALKEMEVHNVIWGEVNILPFSCTRTGLTSVFLRTTKSELRVATIPTKNADRLIGVLKNLPPPPYVTATNVLETSLDNIVPVLDVPIILLNIGLLECTNISIFYGYGLTPPVGRVVDALDAERIAVGKALGLDLDSLPEALVKWYSDYGVKGKSSYEVFNSFWTHKVETPNYSLQEEVERGELAECIPYGLVPLASLGDLLNVPTPATDAIIHLAELITGKDYWREGITVKELGLAGLTAEEIVHYVNTGKK